MSQVTDASEAMPMLEPTLLISAMLSLITLGMVLVYSRKMKDVSDRYVEAKRVLQDVMFSFKCDIQEQERKVRLISQRIEVLALGDRETKKTEQLKSEVMWIKTILAEASGTVSSLCTDLERLSKSVEDLSLHQKEGLRRIVKLEEAAGRESVVMDRIEAAIPLKKDKALAHLTETELSALQILLQEGEKTATQIRERIGLTREHTARLMKSLYTRGYVDRTVETLPYVYRLKGEMSRILERETRN